MFTISSHYPDGHDYKLPVSFLLFHTISPKHDPPFLTTYPLFSLIFAHHPTLTAPIKVIQ